MTSLNRSDDIDNLIVRDYNSYLQRRRDFAAGTLRQATEPSSVPTHNSSATPMNQQEDHPILPEATSEDAIEESQENAHASKRRISDDYGDAGVGTFEDDDVCNLSLIHI